METLVITRHDALVAYLKEEGIIGEDAQVLAHASEKDVYGKRVIGVLPMDLAALTAEYITVALHLPQELRGEELTLRQVRQYATTPARYSVQRIVKAP